MVAADIFSVGYVLPFADARAAITVAGCKCASLAKLSSAGMPVPGGYIVTTAAYDAFLDNNHLREYIRGALCSASLDRPASLELAARTICARFLSARIPPAVASAIQQAYQSLCETNGPVAVRSSAVVQDLPDRLLTGQFDTYLNVQGSEAVLSAVRRCWSSLWTYQAIRCRIKQEINLDAVRMAVGVQVLVPADASGVVISANHANHPPQIEIRAAWGLGEAAIGGLVTPDTLLLDKSTGSTIRQVTAEKRLLTVCAAHGTQEQPVPDTQQCVPVLDDAAVRELLCLTCQIETLYQRPVEIEWARFRNQFFILQARPLSDAPEKAETAQAAVQDTAQNMAHDFAPDAAQVVIVEEASKYNTPDAEPGEMVTIEMAPSEVIASNDAALAHDPDPQCQAAAKDWWRPPDASGKYMRTGMADLLPDPLTPLFGTLGLKIIDAGMAHLPMLPDFQAADKRWRTQVRPHYADTVERWKSKDYSRLPAGGLLIGVRKVMQAAVNHYAAIQSGILPAAYLSERIFSAFYTWFIGDDGPPALTFLLGFDSLPIRAEKSLYSLAQICKDHPSLVDYITTTPSNRIEIQFRCEKGHHEPGLFAADQIPGKVDPIAWRLFVEGLQAHLEHFGHILYNLDFEKPVPADDPVPLIDLLRHWLCCEAASPYERQRAASYQRESATQQMAASLHGIKKKLFRDLVDWAQTYAPLREDSLGDAGLGWPVIRAMLLELGRRLVIAGQIERAGDIFWLTEAEVVQSAARLDRDEKRLPEMTGPVQQRKAHWREEKRRRLPPLPPHRSAEGPDGRIIRGAGISPGLVTAEACVLRNSKDFCRMKPGSILVAPVTTPAWSTLFALAAAVVTDAGGHLNHSSTAVREYEIPAVLGTGIATRVIRDGQQITVDGAAGIVILRH